MDGFTDPCPAPEIFDARLIDARRIELYWNTQVHHADDERYFEVVLDGRVLPLVHWTRDMPWDFGTVY